jgi:hypothetical protein
MRRSQSGPPMTLGNAAAAGVRLIVCEGIAVALAAPFPYMLTGKQGTERALSKRVQMGLRVEVRARAPRPSPYRWEIDDGDNPLPVERSDGTYRSAAKAREAGNAALMRRQET